jgi:electron transport complex protein RnfB
MTADVTALADAVDAELPQTQCRQCGYDGCRPYAEAVARGDAGIGRCPPGGDDGVRALARVTGRPVVPLDPACGAVQPRSVAVIDERLCIGCTLCIAACPVDAIVGAAQRMHTVLTADCTGCGLCLPPCPVDCIAMHALPVQPAPQRPARARSQPSQTRPGKRDGKKQTGNGCPRDRPREGKAGGPALIRPSPARPSRTLPGGFRPCGCA